MARFRESSSSGQLCCSEEAVRANVLIHPPMNIRNLTKPLAIAATMAAITAGAAVQAQEKIRIGVSIPSADHGWTAGVNYAAQETKSRLAKVYPNLEFSIVTATSAADQANSLDDLVSTQHIKALIILPYESGPLTEPVRELKKKGLFLTVVDRALTEPNI